MKNAQMFMMLPMIPITGIIAIIVPTSVRIIAVNILPAPSVAGNVEEFFRLEYAISNIIHATKLRMPPMSPTNGIILKKS